MRSQLSRASLRKLQLQRLKRLARSGRLANEKEDFMLLQLVHPLVGPNLSTDDIFTVDARDFSYWVIDYMDNHSLFTSWPMYLANVLRDYRHQHEIPGSCKPVVSAADLEPQAALLNDAHSSPCGAFSHTCGQCLARACTIRR